MRQGNFFSLQHFRSIINQTDRRTDGRTDGQTDIQTDRRTFFLLVLSSKSHKILTFIKRREFFFRSCDYNTFSFYILRMWWKSKNIVCRVKITVPIKQKLPWQPNKNRATKKKLPWQQRKNCRPRKVKITVLAK